MRYYAELDNLLFQLELNRSKSLEKAFSHDDDLQFGIQNLEYVKNSLGEDILEILPVNNWHLDSDNKYYRQFQNDLVFFVTMSEREKQHFAKILAAMEPTYYLLQQQCKLK